MKLSPARMAFWASCVIVLTAVLLLSQQPHVVGKSGKSTVRMPVDNRIIELDDPADLSRSPEPASRDNATAAPEPARQEPARTKAVQDAPATGKQTSKPVEKKPAPRVVPEKGKAGKAVPAKKPAPSAKGTIRKLALKTGKDGSFSIQVTADAPVGRITYVRLKSPDRFVVDILGSWQLRTRNVIRAKEGMLKHMVAGEHKDRLRLVVHFRTPPASLGKPVIERAGKSATITVPSK